VVEALSDGPHAVPTPSAWRPPRTAVVEVIGPPGVGKSTLVAALARRSLAVKVQGPYKRLRRVPLYGRSLLAVAPLVVRGRAATSVSFRVINWLVRTEASARVVSDLSGDLPAIVVLDQGPLYTLARLDVDGVAWSGELGRWRRCKLDEWGRRLRLVVVLDAPEETLIERIRSRGKEHALKEASPAAARAWVGRYRSASALLVDQLAAGGTPLVRLETSRRTPDDLARRVLCALGDDQSVTAPLDGPCSPRDAPG
jgi:hypothetical protein